jgi:hypothetical protein
MAPEPGQARIPDAIHAYIGGEAGEETWMPATGRHDERGYAQIRSEGSSRRWRQTKTVARGTTQHARTLETHATQGRTRTDTKRYQRPKTTKIP